MEYTKKEIKTYTAQDIDRMYLDYVNNFLTVERFAEYYDLSVDSANGLIMMAKFQRGE